MARKKKRNGNESAVKVSRPVMLFGILVGLGAVGLTWLKFRAVSESIDSIIKRQSAIVAEVLKIKHQQTEIQNNLNVLFEELQPVLPLDAPSPLTVDTGGVEEEEEEGPPVMFIGDEERAEYEEERG